MVTGVRKQQMDKGTSDECPGAKWKSDTAALREIKCKKQRKQKRSSKEIRFKFVKISPANLCQMLGLTSLKWKHVCNLMLQACSDGAPFLFECVPLIGPLVQACRCRCRCCCCGGESQCFGAIREWQQLNANRPIEDGGNYCLAFASERYRLACHAQLSSARACARVCLCVRVCVCKICVSVRAYFCVKPPGVLIQMSSSVCKCIPHCTRFRERVSSILHLLCAYICLRRHTYAA